MQREHFHDNWHDIMRALKQNLSAFALVSPLQPDKGLTRVVPTTNEEDLNIRSHRVVGSPITFKVNFNSPNQGLLRVVIVDLFKDIE